ncbi:diguanylate cyclase [Clostridium sp. AM58-1XD]|nr:diguanylate cyclase [Clostridium sp. AM58-1XD]
MEHVIIDEDRMKKYASVLCEKYDGFYEVDPKERVLRTIFYVPDEGLPLREESVRGIESASKCVLEEDREQFLEAFRPESMFLIINRKYRKVLEFRKMRKDGTCIWTRGILFAVKDKERDVLLFLIADMGNEISALSLQQQNAGILGAFMNSHLGIVELDVEKERAVVIQYTPAPYMNSYCGPWKELLDIFCVRVLYECDRNRFVRTFSIDHLKEMWKRGKDAVSLSLQCRAGAGSFGWVEVTAMLRGNSEDGRMPEKIYITVKDISEHHLMKSIVDLYVYRNCDYFIYLDAGNNSYTMFSGSDSGTPLPPEDCDNYGASMASYARKFVVPEDQERVIHEMEINRVLEMLDKYGEYTVYCGVMDPIRGYTHKRHQYLYYDREKQMILLSRTDITQIYMEQKVQNELLQSALVRAQTDPLTGLYNQSVKDLISDRIARNSSPAAVLFMDLDNFKLVNDTFGHTKGDELLQGISDIFHKVLRSTDLSGRIGGDEFVICLSPADSRAGVKLCARRLCNAVCELISDSLQEELPVSCSIGIAMYPRDGKDVRTLLEKADQATYEAKRNGKNQFVFYSEIV